MELRNYEGEKDDIYSGEEKENINKESQTDKLTDRQTD